MTGRSARSATASRLVLILGGARSGKSGLAFTLAGQVLPRAFVATGEPGDEEMAARIRKHRQDRDPSWETHEIPIDVSDWLKSKGVLYKTVVIDCLTLWLSNLLHSGHQESQVLCSIDELVRSARMVPGTVVLVSNEVGMGIVPADAVTRQFRDLAGVMNQRVAAAADAVYLSVSGLSMKLK